MNAPRALPALAALNGFLAVVFGAFGAHAMTDPQARAWIATATQFQLTHAAVMLAVLAWRPFSPPARISAWCLGVGSLLFASALQALALGAPRGLAMAAPVGGAAMLFGWVLLVIVAVVPGQGQRRGI